MANLYLEQVNDLAIEPSRETDGAACYDLTCCIIGAPVQIWTPTPAVITEDVTEFVLLPGYRALIPTGWKMCCDPGYRIAMYPRSGLSIKKGLSLVNCVGVIDSDYRNEVMIPVINHSEDTITIKHGERLAQIAVEPVTDVNKQIGSLPASFGNRSGGFGSTGE